MAPNADLWCWDCTLDRTKLPAVRAEAHALWQAIGGKRETSSTVFIASDAEPRCALERLALDIFKFHVPRAADRKEFQGVEFWVQLRNSETGGGGLELHFDKDEKLAAEDLWFHPELATATYLSDGGAPLVAFSTFSAETQEDDEGSEEESEEQNADQDEPAAAEAAGGPFPPSAWVSFPRVGRHVAFKGNMLHGVPAELTRLREDGSTPPQDEGGEEPAERLSFLVNLWRNSTPQGPLGKLDVAKLLAAGKKAGAKARPASGWALTPGFRAAHAAPVVPWRWTAPGCGAAADAAPAEGRQGKPKASTSSRNSSSRKFTMGAVVPGTGSYALREHKNGDCGLLPVKAVVRAREACAGPKGPEGGKGPAGRGLVEIRYSDDIQGATETTKVLKRPAAAPAKAAADPPRARQVLKRPAAALAKAAAAPPMAVQVLKRPAAAQAGAAGKRARA